MRLDADKQNVVLDNGKTISYKDEKISRLNNCMTVLNHIKIHGFINSDIARSIGVRRLSGRIYDLRHKYEQPIKTNMPTTKQDRLARYTL